MNVYGCKVGDIVLTGDSYGMDVCVCTKETHYSEQFKFNVVQFLCLTNGNYHESGANNENYQDSCHLISQISQEEVDFLIQKWENKDGILEELIGELDKIADVEANKGVKPNEDSFWLAGNIPATLICRVRELIS